MFILILGSAKDPHVVSVTNILKQRNISFIHYVFGEFPIKSEIGIHLESSGYQTQWKTSQGCYPLEEISAVWYRRPGKCKGFSALSKKEVCSYIEKEAGAFWENIGCLFQNAFLLSDPLQIKIAENKLYQLKLAVSLGFHIPCTYIGNNAKLVNTAFDRHDEILVKAFFQPYIKLDLDIIGKFRKILWKYFNKNIKDEYFPTDYTYREFVSVPSQKIPKTDKEMFLAKIPCCPVIVQKYIPKQLELRITVVGTKVFPCAIYSQQGPSRAHTDWRLATDDLRHEPYELPSEIKDKCLTLVKRLGLHFGCIDMILTPEGKYVFLEINPNGQWFWIQEFTKMPIAQAIADLLINQQSL